MSILNEARRLAGASGAGANSSHSEIETATRTGPRGDGARFDPIDERILIAAGQPAGSPPLNRSVSGVWEGVNELKTQLLHLIRVNKALESDLAHAHSLLGEDARERESLIERLNTAQRTAATTSGTAEEVERIRIERDALAHNIGATSQALAVSEERLVEIGQLLDRFRLERNDATEEVACLDSQFQRAVKVIGELRGDLSARDSREVALREQIRTLNERIETTTMERNTFESELVESHEALEKVRVTIMNASREWGALF